MEHLHQLSPEHQKYFDRLTNVEKNVLSNGASPDDILQLLKQAGESKHARFNKFNNQFAKPFSQFQGVFDVAVSTCSAIGAPIWAPMKLVLQGCSSLSSRGVSQANKALDGINDSR